MRKKLYIFLLVLLVSSLGSISAFAEELPESEVLEDVQIVEEINQTIEYVFEFDQPIATYQVNPDDYNGISTYAITGDVYDGSINTIALSLWNGLLQNNIGKDYLAYRRSQYDYIIFFGEDFQYSGGSFSGSGSYYNLNTQYNYYVYTVGSDSFTVNPSDNYVYTNVTDHFPALETERGLIYAQIQTIVIIALLGFSLLRWIFIGR